jgi:uncharacterized circularly permuted ATP-grasp superfamily protein
MKLICPSGKSYESKVRSVTKSILRCKYSENPTENLQIQEEELKKSLKSLLERSILGNS